MARPKNVSISFDGGHVVLRIAAQNYCRIERPRLQAMGYGPEWIEDVMYDHISQDMRDLECSARSAPDALLLDWIVDSDSPVELADICLSMSFERQEVGFHADGCLSRPIQDENELRKWWTEDCAKLVEGNWQPELMKLAVEHALSGRFDDARAVAKSVFIGVRFRGEELPPPE